MIQRSSAEEHATSILQMCIFSMNMEAARSSEMFVTAYRTTCYQFPKDSLNIHFFIKTSDYGNIIVFTCPIQECDQFLLPVWIAKC